MIAVTGASGLLGGNLIRELLARGECVQALIHQDSRAVSGLDLETTAADLSDPTSLERAFTGVEVVYHLASLISIRMDSWEDVYRVNVIGTRTPYPLNGDGESGVGKSVSNRVSTTHRLTRLTD